MMPGHSFAGAHSAEDDACSALDAIMGAGRKDDKSLLGRLAGTPERVKHYTVLGHRLSHSLMSHRMRIPGIKRPPITRFPQGA